MKTPCTQHPEGRTLFCPTCGHARHDVRDVARRLVGGYGANSPNHRVQDFWESGDPEVMRS